MTHHAILNTFEINPRERSNHLYTRNLNISGFTHTKIYNVHAGTFVKAFYTLESTGAKKCGN
jgi:hypothetical protein